MLEILANKLKLQNVKMKSDSLMSSCPFAKWKHAKKSDSRPSFSLCVKDTGMVVYSCFACGSRGTAKDLAAKLFELNKDPEMLDVIAYIEEHMKFDLDNVIHVKKEEPIFLDEEVHGELCPLVTDHREGLQYCLSRGISKETCERLDLRYHPEDRRVIFKVYDYSGRLLGMSGRSIDPNNNLKILTTVNPGIKNSFIGIHKLDVKLPILLVEGLFMYAKMHEYGLDKKFNILAAMGCSLTKPQRDILISISNKVYIFFDNDEAGMRAILGGKGLKGVNAELGKYLPVYNLEYPENVVDPDVLSQNQVLDMLDNAKHISKV